MAQAEPLTQPPDPPEFPAAARPQPVWPWTFAVAGFFGGILLTFFGVAVAGAIIIALGGKSEGPLFVVVGTLAQGVAFGATAWFLASRVAPPTLWQFGLRRAPLRRTLRWVAVLMVAFYAFTIVYGLIVRPDAEQNTVEALGGDQGVIGLVVAGLMVICVAPFVEEFFFRGFFYRALRSRLSWVAAALVDGLLFGVIHYGGDGLEGLLILPPLAALGFAFCMAYEKTGTLLAPIAMHAVNNSVAYGAQADGGWQVSVVAGPLFLAALVVAARWLAPAPPPGAV